MSSVARTLSDVAARRGSPSLLHLADEMRAGKLPTNEKPADEHPEEEKDSPSTPSSESLESIDTADALSLCGVHLDGEESDGEDLHQQSPASTATEGIKDEMSRQHLKEVEGEGESPGIKTDALNIFSNQQPYESNDDEVSVPGSITSYDEVVECNPNVVDRQRKSSSGFNPTRLSNPDPYEGWDVLLTELQASGRILKDGESVW